VGVDVREAGEAEAEGEVVVGVVEVVGVNELEGGEEQK
jgi:hypothetical protein